MSASMLPDPRFRPAPRRPDPVAMVWLAGAALAVLAYSLGPDRLVANALDAVQQASWYADHLIHNLTLATLMALRAAAIGLYGTYVGLSLLALRRGGQGAGGLIMVTLIFGLLVWGAEGDHPAANARWVAALVLAALAALGATGRLARRPPPGMRP